LAKPLGERLRNQAGNDVGSTAWNGANDETNWPGRIGFRPSIASRCR